MGWKRGVRLGISIGLREARREWRHQQREQERQRKLNEKLSRIRRAAAEVEEHENQIRGLLSLHRGSCEFQDWTAIASSNPPTKPTRSSSEEEKAKKAEANYRPSVIDKIFRLTEKKRHVLRTRIEDARRRDEERYQSALKGYEAEHSEWSRNRELAARVLSGEKDAYLEALDRFNPFTSKKFLSLKLEIAFHEHSICEATVHGVSSDAVPRSAKKLLKSGKLSVKPMAKTDFFAIHRGYVCSLILRVAKEILAILPLDLVIVTATDMLHDERDGSLAERPILSVALSRQLLNKLDLDSQNPITAIDYFPHRVRFKTTTGFTATTSLTLAEVAGRQLAQK